MTQQRTRSTPVHFRSLGLSLAIIGVFVFFGLFSLLPAALVIILRLQGRTFEPSSPWFWTLAASGLALMVICVLAWIGAPRRIRLYFIIGTVLAFALNAYLTARPQLLDFVVGTPDQPLVTSAESLFTSYVNCLLPFRFVTALFVVWYCNRRIVREFYAAGS